MTTGDLKGSLRKLEQQLRLLKYPREVDYSGLAKGDPSSFLPIVSYALVSYSPCLSEHLVGFGIELVGKNDLRFVETVYKCLRDLFNYKPLLTKHQFLQSGFAERKIALLCDIIGFAMKTHKELSKASKPNVQRKNKSRFPSFNPQTKDESPLLLDTDRLPSTTSTKQPLVERHVGVAAPALSGPWLDEVDSDVGEDASPEPDDLASPSQDRPALDGRLEVLERELGKMSALEGRLEVLERELGKMSALEGRLEVLERELGKMSALEGRLEVPERDMAGKIAIDRQDWDNLESRVLLLETRLTLSTMQNDSSLQPECRGRVERHEADEGSLATPESRPCASPGRAPPRSSASPLGTADIHSVVLTDPSEVHIKERLERIANMMKDTSSLLKSVEPSM